MKHYICIVALVSACSLNVFGMNQSATSKAAASQESKSQAAVNTIQQALLLGRRHYLGDKTPKDYTKAKNILKPVATQTTDLVAQANAKLMLASIYYFGGAAVPKNHRKALRYFDAVIAQYENPFARALASYMLGRIAYCEELQNIPKNPEMAFNLLTIAATSPFPTVKGEAEKLLVQIRAEMPALVASINDKTAAAAKRKDHPKDDESGPGAAKRARKEGDKDVSGKEAKAS